MGSDLQLTQPRCVSFAGQEPGQALTGCMSHSSDNPNYWACPRSSHGPSRAMYDQSDLRPCRIRVIS
eukprot:97318-Hanusia_phi.AAC.1